MLLRNGLWLAHCRLSHKGHLRPPKVLQHAYGGRLDLLTFGRDTTRKVNILAALKVSLKQGGSCGVCQQAVASSLSFASQRSLPSTWKGLAVKLTTVRFMNRLRLSNKWPIRQLCICVCVWPIGWQCSRSTARVVTRVGVEDV